MSLSEKYIEICQSGLKQLLAMQMVQCEIEHRSRVVRHLPELRSLGYFRRRINLFSTTILPFQPSLYPGHLQTASLSLR